MTIQFRCSRCDKLLSAPDDAAGKQAKCPNCTALSPIPSVPGVLRADTSLSPSAANSPAGRSAAPYANPFAAGTTPAPPAATAAQPASGGDGSPPSNPFADPLAGRPFKSSPVAPSTNPYATSASYAPEPATFAAPGELRPTSISFDGIWSSTYSIVNQRLGPCFLFGLLLLATGFIFNMITNVVQQVAQATKEPAVIIVVAIALQVLGLVFQTFVQLVGAAFSIRMAREGQAGFEVMSEVGPSLLRGVLVTLAVASMQILVVCVGAVPGAAIGLAIQPPETAIIGAMIGGLIAAIPAVFIGLTCYLSLYFVIDRKMGVIESIRASSTYMAGNRIMVLVTVLALGILGGLVTVVTCCVGLLVVVPFLQLSNAVIYLHATGQPTFDQRPSSMYSG